MIESSNCVSDAEIAQNIILAIAKALVDQPETVQVAALPVGDEVILRLKVAQNDLGTVIGKQGRTARSIRAILSASSVKSNIRFSLDIQPG